jgi:uncharacterized membrane protein YbhN (UPF0104 family)
MARLPRGLTIWDVSVVQGGNEGSERPLQEGREERRKGGVKPILGGWTAVFAVAAVGLAGFLLYRILSRYSLAEVVAAVTTIPLSRLLRAGGFAAASYLCLTGFDWLGLRYAGHPLAYRKAALASFTSLSLGHNIGFAALSSGALRYRFYARWGLESEEIAKVIAFCAATVGLGLMILSGIALMSSPQLAHNVTGLGRATLNGLGSTCLLLAALYVVLAACIRRPLRIRSWTWEMPRLRLALGQVVIGPINFALVAACLYQTVAAVADVAYLDVASVYVIANASALITHVPGGLGVIESVVAFLLPQARLIGALVAFRFIYFLVPLALGGGLFLLTEVALRSRGPPLPNAAAQKKLRA